MQNWNSRISHGGNNRSRELLYCIISTISFYCLPTPLGGSNVRILKALLHNAGKRDPLIHFANLAQDFPLFSRSWCPVRRSIHHLLFSWQDLFLKETKILIRRFIYPAASLTCEILFFFLHQTGHLRTSRGSYFIEPSPAKGGEEEDPQVNRPIRHVLYRIRHREPFDQPLNDRPSSTHRDSLQG